MRSRPTIGRSDVLAVLAAGRDLHSGSAPWTLKFIDLADAESGGAWHQRELDATELLRIVLPPHAGEPCKGDRLTLVEHGGETVARVAARLQSMAAGYARDNPSCWGRINTAAAAPFSAIILTMRPLDTDEHRHLPIREGALYHLDGFHRLLGWAMAGRLTDGARVHAYIAG
jgi:hypothetical protein